MSDPAPSVPREAFKDVYHSVPAEQEPGSEQKPKSRTSDGNQTKAKIADGEDKNDKTAIVATPVPHNAVVLKAPLAFTLAVFGNASESQPAQVDLASGTEDATPQSGGADAKLATPKTDWPVIKEGAPIPAAAVPRSETIAFTARLTPANAQPASVPAQRVSLPAIRQNQANRDARNPAPPASAAPFAKETIPADAVSKLSRPEVIMPARELAAASAVELRTPPPPQSAEPSHTTAGRAVSVQDIQPLVPDIPKPPASSEILLHLGGKDQSAASVRITDRSGTVNVSVHASDPEVRNSLRSNLGDLASQLSSQGFKTELVKPAVPAADTGNQHDSRHGDGAASGQRQHSSTHDGRQPQRDRRSNSQDWLEQLEQQTSRTAGMAKGKN